MSYAKQIDFLLSQVRNSVGSLAGGTITFYAAGTTDLKTIWLDQDKASEAANPYTLDANGTAQLYADGIYKVVIKNVAGSTIYTRDYLYFSPTLPKFSAHKNATNQTAIVTETYTKVTFTTEIYDIGSVYDATNSKWIPGIIGEAHIDACIRWLATEDQKGFVILVYLNGATYKNIQIVGSGTTDESGLISCDIPITAITDYIEIYCYHNGATDKTIFGGIGSSWFMGHMLPKTY